MDYGCGAAVIRAIATTLAMLLLTLALVTPVLGGAPTAPGDPNGTVIGGLLVLAAAAWAVARTRLARQLR
jgi:hypothetical protein